MENVLIINSKGSVGKTPMSFNLAFDLDLNIQTNDLSALLGCYKERTTLTNDLKLADHTLYDLGGFAAPNVLYIAERVDLVIVPINNDKSALIHTNSILKQISPIAKKLIIVTTKTKNKDYEFLKEELNKKFKNLSFFNLPLTEAFNHSIKYGKSVKKLVETNKNQENWFGKYNSTYYIPLLNYVRKTIGI